MFVVLLAEVLLAFKFQGTNPNIGTQPGLQSFVQQPTMMQVENSMVISTQ